jgi:hypothetical protein
MSARAAPDGAFITKSITKRVSTLSLRAPRLLARRGREQVLCANATATLIHGLTPLGVDTRKVLDLVVADALEPVR